MTLNLLNLVLVLLAAWAGGLAARRLGYPAVLGELFAGILLGPPLLNILVEGPALDVLAEVGILLMMFYIGMEIDPRELGRATYAGLLTAVGGFATPFVLCYGLVVASGGTTLAAIFVGMAAGVTALAAKSRILADLRLLDTRIAHVMMAGSIITDTLSLLIFAALVGVAEAGTLAPEAIGMLAVKALLFFGGTTLVGWKLLPLLGRWLQGVASLGRAAGFTLILIIAFAFAEAAELAGLHGVLGTFMAGLFLRENALGRSLSQNMLDLARDASLGFLAPIFFVSAGFSVSLDVFSESLGLLLGLVGLAVVGKIAGTALFYLPTGGGWREGIVIGAGMNGRGVVEIIIAQVGLSLGLISQEIFSILVFMAIFTTAITPATLKWGVEWLRRHGELVRLQHARTGALIVGAGPTARVLAGILARTQPVKLLDRNRELCAQAEEEGLSVVVGNALDERVLEEAGAFDVRTLVAMTPNTEVNAVAAQHARSIFAVPEVLVLNTGDESGHAALLDHVQATTLFGGPVPLAHWDYRVDHGLSERTGVPIEEAVAPQAVFRTLQEQHPSLPLALRRGAEYLPFHGGVATRTGDQLILLRDTTADRRPVDRFDALAARCPVVDLERACEVRSFFEIAAALLADELELPAEELEERFMSRETQGSTVLLPGLAIPHALVEGTGRFGMLIGRCADGILFPGQVERVHAIFVLAGSQDERNFHLRALSAIAQIAQEPAFEHDWLLARDAEALRRLVLSSARRRVPQERTV